MCSFAARQAGRRSCLIQDDLYYASMRSSSRHHCIPFIQEPHMLRTLALSLLLMLGLAMPITDALAQSSSRTRRRRGCYHRWRSWRSTRSGSGSRHGCRRRSPSPPACAWPLLLASWSLLGAHWREIAPCVFSVLQITRAHVRAKASPLDALARAGSSVGAHCGRRSMTGTRCLTHLDPRYPQSPPFHRNRHWRIGRTRGPVLSADSALPR